MILGNNAFVVAVFVVLTDLEHSLAHVNIITNVESMPMPMAEKEVLAT